MIAEIGVQRGSHARCLHNVLRPKKMYLIDCWEPIDRRHKGEDYRDAEENFKSAKSQFTHNPEVKFIRGRSQDEMPKFEENSFDFIYIDGDHYTEACTSDILNALRLVKIGGIVGGHDYKPPQGLPIGGIYVAGAVFSVFEGMFVNAASGDWWVIVDEEKKQLVQSKGETNE